MMLTACLALWSDAYLIDAPNQGAMYQGVKVEICERWGGLHVEVSTRVYREIATRDGGEEQVIHDWTVIARHALKEPEPQREMQ